MNKSFLYKFKEFSKKILDLFSAYHSLLAKSYKNKSQDEVLLNSQKNDINHNSSIYVTKPFLPPLGEFQESIASIWETNILTNYGPLHNELESRLAEFLGVPYISLFSNGTEALTQAIFSLNLPDKSEIITTPFSFIATANAILKNGFKPVFCDVESNTYNIDSSKIEGLITDHTKAIVAVHCYGLPCDVKGINQVAQKYNLEVVYDAAHAFGVKLNNSSILNYGRYSALSFHATKVFNTFEGGAIVSNNIEDKLKVDSTRNFGFTSEFDSEFFGTNAKLSEIHCAMGLLQLRYINRIIVERKKIALNYSKYLGNIEGIDLPHYSSHVTHNYAYYPIVINDHSSINRDFLYNSLKKKNIYTRKYFCPVIPEFSIYKQLSDLISLKSIKNAELVAKNVLCLPIYPGMSLQSQSYIIKMIKKELQL